MPFNKEETLLLTQVGFTKTQAKVYLTLLKMKEADVKTISKISNIQNPEVYRTLRELQEKGLVEKVLATPYRFVATPIEFGLQIILTQKVDECEELREKIKTFLRENQTCQLDSPKKEEYKIFIVEGRRRLSQIIKHQHNVVQHSVDILSTVQRWLQILDFSLETYEKAMNRGVNYRIVLDDPGFKIEFQEKVQTLIGRPNFKLRISPDPLKNNSAIFDSKEATINFFEGKPLGESPIVVTNHPGFISMCQDHFNRFWKSSWEYKL